MGPPSKGSGSALAPGPRRIRPSWLQWGRPPRRADRARALAERRTHPRASMGPPSEESGSTTRFWLVSVAVDVASMGPPSEESGSIGLRVLHRAAVIQKLKWGPPPRRADRPADPTRRKHTA